MLALRQAFARLSRHGDLVTSLALSLADDHLENERIMLGSPAKLDHVDLSYQDKISNLQARSVVMADELTVNTDAEGKKEDSTICTARLNLRAVTGLSAAFGLALMLTSLPAAAQQWTPQQRAACTSDGSLPGAITSMVTRRHRSRGVKTARRRPN
jgi:hypothetical protein